MSTSPVGVNVDGMGRLANRVLQHAAYGRSRSGRARSGRSPERRGSRTGERKALGPHEKFIHDLTSPRIDQNLRLLVEVFVG
jgi:hypothetical protein